MSGAFLLRTGSHPTLPPEPPVLNTLARRARLLEPARGSAMVDAIISAAKRDGMTHAALTQLPGFCFSYAKRINIVPPDCRVAFCNVCSGLRVICCL